MATNDPVEQNIAGVRSLISSRLNKTDGQTTTPPEGVSGDKEDALTLKLDDDELIKLSASWESKYEPYAAKIKRRQDACLAYYLGRQDESEGSKATIPGQPTNANYIFEAEETFLPAALSKNPEPVVWADNTSDGNKIASAVKTMLQFHADTLALRRKLTVVVRKWSVDFLGVLKHGWDTDINDISLEVRDAKNFVFDPEGYVDAYGDFVGYLGEKISIPAYKMAELYPEFTSVITLSVDGAMGTQVTYTQWWNDDYTFTTYKNHVLEKSKNPHFKYDSEEEQEDEFGNKTKEKTPGLNHFAKPKKPYTFLTVFSLERQPHDETSLIEQNIPNQRRITKRIEQIDYNLSRSNNSDVFSKENFTQEEAKQASRAMAMGHPILVPPGRPISEAIHRLQAPQIGSEFFTELEGSINSLRNIFGTSGITATPQDDDQTARGMILQHQYDNSRIGGGIGEALEQVAKNVFNWWTQLYYVYYDEPHFAAVMGRLQATEFVVLKSADLASPDGVRRLVVSVSPDSMKPKDEVTEMNQALSLAESGFLDPKTLLTILNFPDPQTTAAQSVLWKTNPQLYIQLNFPDLAAQIQKVTAPAGPAGPAPGGSSVPPEIANGEPTPPSTGGVPGNPSLSQVPLPK